MFLLCSQSCLVSYKVTRRQFKSEIIAKSFRKHCSGARKNKNGSRGEKLEEIERFRWWPILRNQRTSVNKFIQRGYEIF